MKATVYHYDGIGSVTNVTDATGLPQWSYSYEPFGSSRTTTKINPLAPDNPMRFTGEYLDPTGLYHLRARQYDPGLGRFSATDPLPAGPSDPYVSSYVYVNNRPTLFVDPSGLFCVLGYNPNGSCRGTGVATRVGHVGRSVLNSPKTAAGVIYANLNRGSCDMEYGAMVACYGVREWANGPMTHFTFGGVILSENKKDEFAAQEGILAHESKHATQWLDPMFPVNYAKGALISKATGQGWICGNP